MGGDNLEGRHFRLPDDFEGDRNVVLIAFAREQQAEVESWLPALRRISAEIPGVRSYELPTIKEMGRLMRWIINSGMSRGIDDPKVRASTITLFLEKEPFRKALGIRTAGTITLVVVDRKGRIFWQTAGTATPAKISALETILRTPSP